MDVGQNQWDPCILKAPMLLLYVLETARVVHMWHLLADRGSKIDILGAMHLGSWILLNLSKDH